jgi:inhibitor of cysteine peptidase
MVLRALGVVVVALTASPVVAQQVRDMAQETVVTESDNGKEVALRVGQQLALSLPENASTGYRWDVEEGDGSLLEIRQAEATYPSSAIGSAGRAHWIVRAKAAGTTRLGLKLWRRWEGDKPPAERYDLRVRILP